MNETKSPFTSLGIMGPLAGVIVFVLNLIYPGLGLTAEEVSPIVEAASVLWTTGTAIYGRLRATKRISFGGNSAS